MSQGLSNYPLRSKINYSLHPSRIVLSYGFQQYKITIFYTKALDLQGFGQLANKIRPQGISSSRSDSLFWIMVVFVLCKIMTFAPLTHKFQAKLILTKGANFTFPVVRILIAMKSEFYWLNRLYFQGFLRFWTKKMTSKDCSFKVIREYQILPMVKNRFCPKTTHVMGPIRLSYPE